MSDSIQSELGEADLKNLNTAKALAFIELRKEIVISKLEHQHRFEEGIAKSLLLANGAALIAMGSALDALLQHQVDILSIKVSFFLYFSGLVAASYVYLIFAMMTFGAPEHYYTQYVAFLNNQINFAQLTGYGFNEKGKWQFRIASGASLLFFIIGSGLLICSF